MGLLKYFTTYHIYNDCSDLPIGNFDAINKTKDLKYLVVEFNGYKKVQIPKDAQQRWEEIKKEWYELVDDNEIAYYYNLLSEVNYLQARYDAVKMLLYQIYIRNMDDRTLDMYVGMLLEWRYKWNKENDRLLELKRMMNQHKASTNKLGLKVDELEQMKKKYDEAPSSIEKQAVRLEQATGRNNIDIWTTSVKKWVELITLANLIIEKHGK